ncbi:MAG: hypothetical protein ACLU37_04350 [Collinsella sp.]
MNAVQAHYSKLYPHQPVSATTSTAFSRRRHDPTSSHRTYACRGCCSCRCSRSTASRALNDSPRISEETKNASARRQEVNFVPNARGRALAVGRTEIIAVLVTEPLSELFSDPTYSEF